MRDYRLTVSRDRLAEFRRNSEIIPNAALEARKQHEERRLSLQNFHVAPSFNQYNPHPTYANRIRNDSFTSRHSVQIDHPPQNIKIMDSASTDVFFQKIEDFKQRIAKINANVTRIESLHIASLSSINGEHAVQVNYALDSLVNETSNLNNETRNYIKETEIYNSKLPLNPSDRNMRAAQLQAIKKKFMETVQRYQGIAHTYEKKQKERIERQILIVKPEASAQEIEAAIDSDDAPQIFAHSLLNLSRVGNAGQVLSDVQTRHRNIKRIEKTIMELHQLFLDLQQMLELQQDKILYIEKSAENVNYDLEQGDKHVAVAVSSSKLTRKKKWFSCAILVVLLIVVAILVWWFAFPKSRSSSPTILINGQTITS